MRDLLPEELERWQSFEEKARQLLARYGYQEIRTPVVEEKGLFERSVGEQTDIVTKEMYTFLDRKGRKLALRPEGTASVVRAYLEANYFQKRKISRFWYLGPMFRYDRPQKGRYRQFYQLGVEVFGGQDPFFDVEVMALMFYLVNSSGVTDLTIHLNHLGCAQCQHNYLGVLQKFVRPRAGFLCCDCQRRLASNTLRIFDCKNERCAEVLEEAPLPGNYLCQVCQDRYEKVHTGLKALGLSVFEDKRLVRGLDYYTGTVFEAMTGRETNAVAAGGRYDTLTMALGGPAIPAVGFAIGLDRLMALCSETSSKLPVIRAIFLGEEARKRGFLLLEELRREGLRVETDYEERPLKNHLQTASREKVVWCLILGENELNREQFVIKNMETRRQYEISFNGAGQKVKELVC
ncbi:MAG TPA: histidine--tRNA ligase [bacterium]|nr:histidine--tRNA ligase [bacterium]